MESAHTSRTVPNDIPRIFHITGRRTRPREKMRRVSLLDEEVRLTATQNTSAGHERPWRNAGGGLVLDLSPVPVRYPHYKRRLTLALFLFCKTWRRSLSLSLDHRSSFFVLVNLEIENRIRVETRVVRIRGGIESWYGLRRIRKSRGCARCPDHLINTINSGHLPARPSCKEKRGVSNLETGAGYFFIKFRGCN